MVIIHREDSIGGGGEQHRNLSPTIPEQTSMYTSYQARNRFRVLHVFTPCNLHLTRCGILTNLPLHVLCIIAFIWFNTKLLVHYFKVFWGSCQVMLSILILILIVILI